MLIFATWFYFLHAWVFMIFTNTQYKWKIKPQLWNAISSNVKLEDLIQWQAGKWFLLLLNKIQFYESKKYSFIYLKAPVDHSLNFTPLMYSRNVKT